MGKEGEPKIEKSKEEAKLKDFNVEKFFIDRGKISESYEAPDEFRAKIDSELSTDDLIDEVVDNIRNLQLSDEQKQLQHRLIFSRNAKIRYGDRAIDEENNLAAFVLLQENPIVGGMSWNEAIYVIEKAKNEVRGRTIAYNSGYHTRTSFGEEGENEGSELMVKEIKNGVLKYILKTKDGSTEKEIDLKKERITP